MEAKEIEVVVNLGPVESALAQTLILLTERPIKILSSPIETSSFKHSRIGIMYAESLHEGCSKALNLLSVGCCCLIVCYTKENEVSDPSTWKVGKCSWPDQNKNLYSYRLMITKLIQHLEILQGDLKNLPANELEWRCAALRRKFEAIALYTRLEIFSHGEKNDISNTFLAPARLLCQAGVNTLDDTEWFKKAHELCNLFESNVINPVRENRSQSKEWSIKYGELGSEILEKYQPIENWHKEKSNRLEVFKDGHDLGELMQLMTQIRVLADVKTSEPPTIEEKQDNDSGIYVAIQSEESYKWRILVIDDHFKNWLPVLQLIKEKMLQSGDDLEIEISDGMLHMQDEPFVFPIDYSTDLNRAKALYRSLPEYDLILLDIFLGKGKKTGIQFLKELRERRIYVPVILLTTATDKELPAAASMANGYLFKKTTSVKEMIDALRRWLAEGRSQRLWSLPNPFFDHVIRTLKLREVALDLTKWTLRYMDCFHAIDDEYFRYFNDHGGRHIIGVLGVLEKILRPFLMIPDEVLDKNQSELELFRLYVAVLFHEYGMFPIRSKETKPSQKAVEAMRKTHALRGMALLCSHIEDLMLPDSEEYDNVAGLQRRLKEMDNVSDEDMTITVATLVGYHQRFLRMDKENTKDGVRDRFLVFNNTDEEWNSLINTQKNCDLSKLDPMGIQAVLKRVSERLNQSRISKLRQQCALLRFADALDVDSTRAPADFLFRSENRRRMQDVEDCKRLVLMNCDIDRGLVSVGFMGAKPNLGMAETLLPLCKSSIEWHMKPNVAKLDKKAYTSADTAEKWITSQKQHCSPDIDLCNVINKAVCELSKSWNSVPVKADKHLDKYLKKVKNEVAFLSHSVAGYFVECYKSPNLDASSGQQKLAFLRTARPVVSTAAALLVLVEILDEYKAIVDAELNEIIQLNPLPNWNSQKEGEDPWPFLLNMALDELAKRYKENKQ